MTNSENTESALRHLMPLLGQYAGCSVRWGGVNDLCGMADLWKAFSRSEQRHQDLEESIVRAMIEGRPCQIAEHEGRIVGFSLTLSNPLTIPSDTRAVPVTCVDPAFPGLGQELDRAVIAQYAWTSEAFVVAFYSLFGQPVPQEPQTEVAH